MIDKQKVEQAVALFLEAIGEDPSRPGLVDTPDRIARMCQELFGGLEQTAAEPLAKRFPVDANNLVMEKDITFYSVCEHHLLPFYGKVHIAYRSYSGFIKNPPCSLVCRNTPLATAAILLTAVSKMAARNDTFVMPYFE